jgi:hypothetical protein
MRARHGVPCPAEGWQGVYTLHCGALPTCSGSLDVHILASCVGEAPVGLQRSHTPLGPIVLHADQCAPPELLAALDGLFPPVDIWSTDPPPRLDPDWSHSLAVGGRGVPLSRVGGEGGLACLWCRRP